MPRLGTHWKEASVRPNTLREAWTSGRKTINGWLGIPSTVSAEAMAQGGWDSITVDCQHGPIDFQASVACFQAIAPYACTPMARVPWLEPGIIMKLLDAGAYGIICPMVNTREEAERFVGACRYYPAGYRSFGPTRVSWYAGADYYQHANASILTLAMIETRQALSNLDDILSVPGLDGVYVGPADLAITLGEQPVGDPTSTVTLGAIREIVAKTKAKGLFAGIHTASAEGARDKTAMGYDFATILADTALLSNAAKAAVTAFRGAASAAKAGGPY
jgi:4-hydroxy-2-oxoheptanedioate aldolase